MIPYEKARAYPPIDNKAYIQATSAEWLGLELGLDPAAVYEWAELFAVSLYEHTDLFMVRRKLLGKSVNERTRAYFNLVHEEEMTLRSNIRRQKRRK